MTLTKQTKLGGKLLVLPILASMSAGSALADSNKKIDWLEEAKQTVKKIVSAEAEMNARISSLEDGESTLVYDPSINAEVMILKERCLTLKTSVGAHDKDSDNNFHDSSLNSGVLDGSHSDIDVAVNHLYVQSDCLLNEALQIQAGAMPIQSDGSMGIDSDGFTDAIRAAYQMNLKLISSVSASIGRLDPNASVDVFDRDYDDLTDQDNFKQVTVMGGSDDISYGMELTRLNDTDYIRASASIAISALSENLDNIRVEVLREEDEMVGKEISVSSASFANGTRLVVGYRDLEEGTSLPIDEKTLQDEALFAKLIKKVSQKCHLGLAFQNGKNEGARGDVELGCRY